MRNIPSDTNMRNAKRRHTDTHAHASLQKHLQTHMPIHDIYFYFDEFQKVSIGIAPNCPVRYSFHRLFWIEC